MYTNTITIVCDEFIVNKFPKIFEIPLKEGQQQWP